MDSSGISNLLVKAKLNLSKAEEKQPSHEDINYEDRMMIASVYAIISLAESLEHLSKKTFGT